MDPVTPVFRAPMRARDRDVLGADHGIEHGLVGIGEDRGGRLLERFAGLPDGVFVWTRDSDGMYWLGRITGPWRRDDSPAASEVGIHHVRPTTWLSRPFGEPEVPVAVAATFARGGRNLQRIADPAAEQRTAQLWQAA